MDVFVARQPIFDRNSQVYAYELLYRSGIDRNEFTGTDEDRSTLEVIAGSLLTIGLNSIAGRKKAFINFGHKLLTEGLVTMLPSENVVIEVLETAEPDGEIVKTCRKLRSLGYTIALDDFVWHPRFEPLIELADVVKVDMRTTSRDEQERLVSNFRLRGIAMLAEKVETREEFEWAAHVGYDYFQGYFFARPAIISGKEIQPAVVTCLRLLRQLQTPELDFRRLEELIRRDVALTYKLFRYVNSVLFARRGNIQSLRQALAHLGEDGIRRWATVATLPRLTQGKPEELAACALVRARFSENLARLVGDPSFPSAYLIGLFSVLDALLDRPLEEALAEVGLGPHINDVLLGAAAAQEPLVTIYALVRSYEAGEWDPVADFARRLGLADSALSTAYVEATEWTNQTLAGIQISEPSPTTRLARPRTRKERRHGERHPITAMVAMLWGAHTQEENVTQATLVEVSDLGARFRLAVRVPPGSWVMFNHHKIGIGGRGVVRHCRMVKGMYEIGVQFSSGTGWNAVSRRMNTDLRGLNGAIDRLDTAKALLATNTGNSSEPV